uniref:VWFA domain-containing protein n=1 Tax=Clytia hemisphaerica TaxID=252671 RepID=A0A7M5WZH9_9CNID
MRNHCVIYYVIIVLSLFHWPNVNGEDVLLNRLKDGSKNFQQELTKLVKLNLGYQTLQDQFNQMSQEKNTIQFDAHSKLKNFVRDFERKTEIAENVLNHMATYILEDYKTNNVGEQRSIESCCQFDESNLEFNSIFGEKISMDHICEQTPTSNSDICPTLGRPKSSEKVHLLNKKKILDSTRSIYEKEAKGEARNIQYDSLDGYSFTYPAYQDPSPMECTCAQRDPRFSSRLAETLAGNKGRHFLIVLDYSEKIQNTIAIMRKVATTLLKLVTSKDMISVKFYHEDNLVPGDNKADCLKISSKATPYLKDKILKEIETKQPKGDAASYSKIFRESFTALKNEHSNQTEKHFIFVTSGYYIDSWSEVQTVFEEGREDFGCDLSFSLLLLYKDGDWGTTTYNNNKNLKGVGCNVKGRDNFMEFELGKDNNHFTINSKISAILSSAKNFNDFNDKVHYIMPISDRFGRGTTIDACKAVVDKSSSSQNPMKGAVCLSFLTNEFIREEWSQTENSYWFLIKKNGQTFIHPKFGQPLGSDELSRTVSILQIESSQSFKDEVYDDMISGNSGTKILLQVIAPKGRGPFGASSHNTTLTYTWRAVPKSDFVLAIVTSSGFYDSKLKITDQGGAENYHRIDLWNSTDYDGHLCKYSGTQVAVKDLAVIKFPAYAFLRPSVYYKLEKEIELVQQLKHLCTPGSTTLPPAGFFRSIDSFKNLCLSAKATHGMNAFWNKDKSEETVNILSRYVGMENGFFRAYPGHLMNPSYDPRARPWYRLMIAQKGITLTTPYPDAFTGENVMTLGKVLLKGGKSTERAGVMAMDFKLTYMKYLLERTITECDSGHHCVVIDRNGFVVYQSSFMEKNKNPTLENQHIVKMHGVVAKSMIEEGVMIKNYCLEIRNNITIKEWFYSLDHVTESKKYQSSRSSLDYRVVPIIGSNLLLLYINGINDCSGLESCNCQDPTDGERFGYCSNDISETNCECPCIQPVTCLSDLRITPGRLECNPEDKRKTDFSEKWFKGNISELTLCFDPECKKRDTWDNCESFKPACNWCFKFPNGTHVADEKKHCDYSDEECFPTPSPPIITPAPPTTPDSQETEDLSDGAIAVIILFSIIFVCSILGGIYWWFNKKAKRRQRNNNNNGNNSNTTLTPRANSGFDDDQYQPGYQPSGHAPNDRLGSVPSPTDTKDAAVEITMPAVYEERPADENGSVSTTA